MFPLSEASLWRGQVLDIQGRLHLLYEVWIDEKTQVILNGHVDPVMYWQAEEQLFREQYQSQIFGVIVKREKCATGLQIVTGAVDQHPLTDAWVWSGKLMDSQSNLYRLAVDARGQEVDYRELLKPSAEQTHYGKLESRLFYLLPMLSSDDKLRVLLWASGVDYTWVDTQLMQTYPEIPADYFAGGQPFTGRGQAVVLNEELFSEVRRTYNDLLDQAYHRAVAPIVSFLEVKGYSGQVWDIAPCVYVELPVSVIRELNTTALENLSNIYLGEIGMLPQTAPVSSLKMANPEILRPNPDKIALRLDTVHSTIQVDSVWNQGYTGQGVRLGIMDVGSLDPSGHPAFDSKWIFLLNLYPVMVSMPEK